MTVILQIGPKDELQILKRKCLRPQHLVNIKTEVISLGDTLKLSYRPIPIITETCLQDAAWLFVFQLIIFLGSCRFASCNFNASTFLAFYVRPIV